MFFRFIICVSIPFSSSLYLHRGIESLPLKASFVWELNENMKIITFYSQPDVLSTELYNGAARANIDWKFAWCKICLLSKLPSAFQKCSETIPLKSVSKRKKRMDHTHILSTLIQAVWGLHQESRIMVGQLYISIFLINVTWHDVTCQKYQFYNKMFRTLKPNCMLNLVPFPFIPSEI